MRRLSVKVRLFLMSAVALLATLLVGVLGVGGLKTTDENANYMYTNSAVPAIEIGTINGTVGKMVADLLLSFQHDPAGSMAKLHDHPVTAHFESGDAWRKVFEAHWAKAKGGMATDAEQKLAKVIDDNYKGFISEVYEPVKASISNGDYSAETLVLLITGFKKYAEPLEKTISEAIRLQEGIAEQMMDATNTAYTESRNLMIAAIVASVIVMLILAISIATSIAEPLSRISSNVENIVRTCDFTSRIEVKAQDEVGRTAKSFNELLNSLQNTFKTMLNYVSQFDGASEELARLSDKVAKASVKTSDSSSDMAASVEEMTASIVQVSENAQETNKNAEEVMTLSEDGSEIVNKTISEMQKMSQAVENSSETIGELGKQSEQISGIVQTIKDVADQTNLLALNAAIEAARAGEQGRGFAVVADEIRKLAERTTRATTEIAAMISAIQESSHTAVTSMTHAANMVNEGVSLAEQAGESIAKIQHGAQQAKTRVSSITAALNEQSSASHQIATQVEKVAQATDENSEAATSSSKAAEHIAKLARSMREAMAKFKV